MTQTLKTEALPEGMALLETFDGRWFPAFVPPGEKPLRWVHLIGGLLDIPPALDLDPSEGYQVREEAIGACWAWHEAAILPLEWERLAAHIEVYPERTAWYLDEIAHLIGNGRPAQVSRTYAYAMVTTVLPQESEVVTARGATPDEVIETLYQRVYEWYCQQQPVARAS